VNACAIKNCGRNLDEARYIAGHAGVGDVCDQCDAKILAVNHELGPAITEFLARALIAPTKDPNTSKARLLGAEARVDRLRDLQLWLGL